MTRLLFALAMVLALNGTAHGQDAPAIVGQIAVIGVDDNVYVIGPDGSSTALTTDATPGRRYQFPTWSTDGRLAFFCCDINFGSDMRFEAYVASPDLTAAKLLYSAADEGYTYSYWSPANCAGGSSCRELAVLLTSRASPFKVELIRQDGTTTTSRTIGSGAPFYFSWNRDGQQMLWHRNNAQVSRFDSADDALPVHYLDVPGSFQAPAWSPVDDRAAFVVTADGGITSEIIVMHGDDRTVLLSEIPASIRGFANVMALNWSPDGRYLAYRAINRFGASPVFVVDSETGTPLATSADSNVISFFWSPDSAKLVYMTPQGTSGDALSRPQRVSYQGSGNLFAWSILDVESGSSSLLASFSPTPTMLYLLVYFDQFAQSHQLWSPDSRYIVYAELDDVGGSSVKILDTTSETRVPLTIADGHIGVWSYHEAGESTGG